MMKIAILTLRLKTNYGGLLQAYALQKHLKKKGHMAITVYHDHDLSLFYKIMSVFKRFLMKVINRYKGPIRIWPTMKEFSIMAQNTNMFILNSIKRTRRVNLGRELLSLQHEYKFDAFIVGSDQCWKAATAKRIQNMYLESLQDENIIRISYAASFGTDSWEYNLRQTRDCKRLIQKFDGISFREKSGVILCKQFFEVDAVSLVDPTMLLSKEDYLSLLNEKLRQSNERNLMVYLLDNSREKEKIVERLSSSLDLPINKIGPEKMFSEVGVQGIEKTVYPSVEKWLEGYENANFIFTDSFHGTVFAIIFNKPFVVYLNRKRGATRFVSLLNTFKLENRLVSSLNDVNEILLHEEINFSEVNEILERERIKANNFLNTYLSITSELCNKK